MDAATRAVGHTPLPEAVTDIAELVAFLCSDAASFISGCDIRIDGGLIGSGRIQPVVGELGVTRPR